MDNVFCVPVKKEKEKRWRLLGTETGRGVYGSVRTACEKITDDCSYVFKIIPIKRGFSERAFKKEVRLQQILATKGLALSIMDWWICRERPKGVIVMHVLDMTAEKFLMELDTTIQDQIKLMKAILGLMDDLHKTGYYHGDLHLGNIMLKRVSSKEKHTFSTSLGMFRVYLIDLGKGGSLKRPGKLFGKPLTAQKRIDTDLNLLTSEFKTYGRKAFLLHSTTA